MKIGLTYTGDPVKHQNYVNWLKGDENIDIVKLSVQDDNAAALNECDALVLSGGVDMDPAIAGGPAEYANQPGSFQPERDLFEKNLYEQAKATGLPVLGICRGMQLINVLEGGTLIEDLGTLNGQHQKTGVTDRVHNVQLIDNTLLKEIVNTTTGEINSAHHQAVSKLGEVLQANSMAEDGTIEGLEWKDKKDKPFLLCVQWHPERMVQFPNSPLSINIRNRFIDEIKKFIAKRNENL
jgi:putative glutamine amidotransferase